MRVFAWRPAHEDDKMILSGLITLGDMYGECLKDEACTPEEHQEFVDLSAHCERLILKYQTKLGVNKR